MDNTFGLRINDKVEIQISPCGFLRHITEWNDSAPSIDADVVGFTKYGHPVLFHSEGKIDNYRSMKRVSSFDPEFVNVYENMVRDSVGTFYEAHAASLFQKKESFKEETVKGNQLGLSLGDKILIGADQYNQISDTKYDASSGTFEAEVVGWSDKGYPVVFIDNISGRFPHRSLKALAPKATFNFTNKAFTKLYDDADQGRVQEALLTKGMVMELFSTEAFRRLGEDKKPVMARPVLKFGLSIGDVVEIAAEHASSTTNGLAQARVIGCSADGSPLVLFSHNHKIYGPLCWPIGNIIDDQGQPRIESTIFPQMRQKFSFKIGSYDRYISAKYILKQEDFRKIESSNIESEVMKKNFSLDFGDLIRVSYDQHGLDFAFDPNHQQVVGQIIGFDKYDGSPMVALTTPIPGSWRLSEVTDFFDHRNKEVLVAGGNLNADKNLLQDYIGKQNESIICYIGNLEQFKVVSRGKKDKKMATKNDGTRPEYGDDVVHSQGDDKKTGILARLQQSAVKSPNRVIRMQAVTNGKDAVLGALKGRLDENSLAIVEGALNTDAGKGAVLALLGMAGPMVPKYGQDPRVTALCEEFLDEGVAMGANEALNLLGSILAPVFANLVASLPPVATAVTEKLTKKERHRISEAAATKDETEELDEDEDDVEVKTSSKVRR